MDVKNILFLSMISIITYNVNGLRGDGKRHQIFNFLKSTKADVFFLQETHKNPRDEWTQEWGGKALWSSGGNHTRGVGLLVNPDSNFVISEFKCDFEGRLIIADMVHQGDHVTLCSIYAPDTPGERPDFFEFLKSELVNFRPRGPLILGGDFNFVINPTSDRVGENIYRPQFIRGRDEFYDIINLFDLFDPFRVRQGGQQGGQREYTWSNNAGSIRSRLDRFYAPLDSEMAEIKHLNSNLSDHRPVQLKFQSRKQERGQGCWKLNTLVLEEWEYRDRVEGALAAAKYRKDEIKAQIAEISKSY